MWLPATPRLLVTASFTSGHVILLYLVARLPLPLPSPAALLAPPSPLPVAPRLPWPEPAAASCALAPSAAAGSEFLSVALLERLSGTAASPPFSGRMRCWLLPCGGDTPGVRLTILHGQSKQQLVKLVRGVLPPNRSQHCQSVSC